MIYIYIWSRLQPPPGSREHEIFDSKNPAGESPWYNWIGDEKYTGSMQAQKLVDSVYDVCTVYI